MQIGDVQQRMIAIQSRIAAIEAVKNGPAVTGTATATANGARFATAMTEAVAAQEPTTGTGASTLPGTRATVVGAPTGAMAAAVGTAAGNPAGAIRPSDGRITSEFGPRWGTKHEGLDIAAAKGSPVRAASAGVVRRADWNGGYGNAVIIDHGAGMSTLYGHNSALTVKEGQRVEAGQVIAKAGSTGDSTGPHVHFEVRRDDEQIDPRPWLESRGVRV